MVLASSICCRDSIEGKQEDAFADIVWQSHFKPIFFLMFRSLWYAEASSFKSRAAVSTRKTGTV